VIALDSAVAQSKQEGREGEESWEKPCLFVFDAGSVCVTKLLVEIYWKRGGGGKRAVAINVKID
jgi:hypothetical protein